MIDCLYTGPAHHLFDCWWGDRVRTYISVPWSSREEITEALNEAKDTAIVRIADMKEPLDFINPRIFECDDNWNIPAKAPGSLQDRLPEKG